MTNSFKHAFAGGAGTLTIRLGHRDGDAMLTLADDGPGMPAEPKAGLGLKLIGILSRQIAAETAWDCSCGTCLTLQLPIKVA